MSRLNVITACALLAISTTGVLAQKYPTRPVRLIAPFAPGGGTDILSRTIGPPLSAALGQPVVVDNRPGAGGALGAELAAKAEPDGYTFITVSSSYAATSAFHKLNYDPVEGITPLILLGTTGMLLTANPALPVKSVKELIAYARAHPGKLSYGTVGIGSVTHFAHELFNLEAKISSVHIPFKGAGPAIIGIIGNEAQIGFLSAVPVLPHMKAGRLKVYAISTAKRSPALPDVPSVGEFVPGFDVPHWYAMWGPKGIPKNIVALWNREVGKILAGEDMNKQMRNEGMEPVGGGPENFHNILKPTVERWRRVVKEAKLQ
ncbi:MAG: tripartite tricarboxylate transporter substrate binding protein [Betaproteobacteria bacterium]|nr:tripartite tricarboxylate transporter substrate binding protein [Betaproteobacteria bacterium]